MRNRCGRVRFPSAVTIAAPLPKSICASAPGSHSIRRNGSGEASRSPLTNRWTQVQGADNHRPQRLAKAPTPRRTLRRRHGRRAANRRRHVRRESGGIARCKHARRIREESGRLVHGQRHAGHGEARRPARGEPCRAGDRNGGIWLAGRWRRPRLNAGWVGLAVQRPRRPARRDACRAGNRNGGICRILTRRTRLSTRHNCCGRLNCRFDVP